MADESEAMDRAMLARAAGFFSQRPDFLGYWLERYRNVEEMEPLALARLLGCTVETVDRLALCFAPRREELERDVSELAERFAVEPDQLADVLLAAWGADPARTSLGMERTAGSAVAPSPVFAAASDREPEPVIEQEQEPHGG